MKYLNKGSKYLRKKDPSLNIILDAIDEVDYEEVTDVMVTLMKSIVSQQLSTKVAKVIWKRFSDLFESGDITTQSVLDLEPTSLRAIGFSNAKAGYVRNIAEYFRNSENENTDWHQLADEEILEKLTSIKGVGAWTVHMLLIFGLQRPDIWPVKDLGIQQAFAKLHFQDPKDKALTYTMLEMGEHWRPYRSLVALALWRWKDRGYPGIENELH